MTKDLTPATNDAAIDPDILQVLAPLVDLAGAIDSAESLLGHVATFYGAAQMTKDIYNVLKPRRKKYAKAIAGIRKGIRRLPPPAARKGFCVLPRGADPH